MTSAVWSEPSRARAPHAPRFALLLCCAWIVLAGQLVLQHWAASAWTMPDADDAMRLVEVREFLSGRGWFDLHEPRLNPPLGYDTHWSRLVDAGIAGLYLVFRAVADRMLAERLTSVLWPMLWLIPAMASAAAIGWRIGGRDAALGVLVLAMFCGLGVQPFRPGRIDHHNVQIAFALLAVAATVWSDRLRWIAWACGAPMGPALAVGFESVPFLVLCGAAFALRYVADGQSAPALRAYGLAIAASTIAGFVVSVPPARWSAPVCDMIAVNSAAAVVVAGLGLAAAGYWPAHTARDRMAAIAAVSIAAAAVFVAIEPRCLGGVYAMVDPAIRPIWLDEVSETKTVFELARSTPGTAMAVMSFPLVALAAAAMVMRERALNRSFGPLAALAALFVAVIYTVAVNRGISYAIWLGMPFVAAAAVQIFTRFGWRSLALRFAALIVLTPTAVVFAAISLASAAGQTSLGIDWTEREACVDRANYSALAQLPPGLVAASEIEFGPYLLAWTPHAVLAAPYHRAPTGILAAARAFAAPPDRAHQALNEAGVGYLMICGLREPRGPGLVEWRAGLLGRLAAGAVPPWLEPVAEAGGNPIRVYRVKP